MNEIAFINGYIEKLAVSPSAKIMGGLSPYFDDIPELVKQMKKYGLKDSADTIITKGDVNLPILQKDIKNELRGYDLKTEKPKGGFGNANRLLKRFRKKTGKRISPLAPDSRRYLKNKSNEVEASIPPTHRSNLSDSMPTFRESPEAKQLRSTYEDLKGNVKKIEQKELSNLEGQVDYSKILSDYTKDLSRGPGVPAWSGNTLSTKGEDVAKHIYKGTTSDLANTLAGMHKSNNPIFHSGYPEVAAGYSNGLVLKGDVPALNKARGEDMLFTPHLAESDTNKRLATLTDPKAIWNINSRGEEYVGKRPNYETVLSESTPLEHFKLYSKEGNGLTRNSTIHPLLNKKNKTITAAEVVKATLGKKWDKKLARTHYKTNNSSTKARVLQEDVVDNMYNVEDGGKPIASYLSLNADSFPTSDAPLLEYYNQIRQGVRKPKVNLKPSDLMSEGNIQDYLIQYRETISDLSRKHRPRINTSKKLDIPERKAILDQIKKYRETGEL